MDVGSGSGGAVAGFGLDGGGLVCFSSQSARVHLYQNPSALRPHLTAWQDVQSFPSSVTCLSLFHHSIVIYNVALISAVQKSHPAVYICILFCPFFYYGLSQDIGYSSLGFRVGPYCLSILCSSLCLLIPNS